MTNRIFIPFLIGIIFFVNNHLSAQIQKVKVSGGIVEGVINEGISSFKGIPFAAPPIGKLRWKSPQPIVPWDGVKKADAFASAPIQNKMIAKMYFNDPVTSEDCLYLNVWTSAKSPDEKLPVVMWIHGGGFAGGATSIPAFQGTSYAKEGIVFVSAAYRIGPFGFLAHPDLSKESGKGSGCYGIQDQIAALKWINENIKNFGGDPKNITIFGESAGGISTSIISIVPEAKGLFQHIICQSGAYMQPLKNAQEGGMWFSSLKLAEEYGEKFLNQLGVNDIEAARQLSPEQIQKRVARFDLFPFFPVADGVTIPADGYKLYQEGKFNDVDVMVGFNSDEGAVFVQSMPVLKTNGFEKMVRDGYGLYAESLLKVYPHSTDKEAFKSQKDFWRDPFFGWPTWALANLHTQKSKNKTFVYYFDYHNEKSPEGASHGAEVPYVLKYKAGIKNGDLSESDNAMMNLTSSYWINFVKKGNPNGKGLPKWPIYNPKKKMTMIFDNNSSSRPFPNVEKYKTFDSYYEWRSKQERAKK